jgi:hypothetical protein
MGNTLKGLIGSIISAIVLIVSYGATASCSTAQGQLGQSLDPGTAQTCGMYQALYLISFLGLLIFSGLMIYGFIRD